MSYNRPPQSVHGMKPSVGYDLLNSNSCRLDEDAAFERAIELLEGAADLEYVCPDIYPKDLA